VSCRSYTIFDVIAETVLEEESAIFSKNEKNRYTNFAIDGPRCSNYHKLGHPATHCSLRDKLRFAREPVNCETQQTREKL
jgi:hypothetical protein